jgi:hypothetical protein
MKSLSGNNYNYAEMLSVPSPYGAYNLEGIRNLKFAYAGGENTGIVLIPITQPDSSTLNRRSEPNAIFSSWDDTINSARNYGGVAAFLWDPSDFGNPEFTDMFTQFVNNATSNGVTVTTPDAIARHFKQLEAIRVNVARGDDYGILHARNTGSEPVSGITYQLIMPVIGGACPYTISDGTIARSDIKDDKCRVYASFDLNAYQTKEIQVTLGIPRKNLNVNIPDLYQGKNTIKIVDGNNQPVRNASVRVDSQYYETDNKGAATFSVNSGKRTITVEKAGYNPITTTVYVQPPFYRYISFLKLR